MSPQAALPVDVQLVLITASVIALLATLIGLVIRSRARRRRQSVLAAALPLTTEPQAQAPEPAPVQHAEAAAIDAGALRAAVKEAEAEGNSQRLPGLYFSLAQMHIGEGDTRAAGDMLRQSIRAATTAGTKDTHAKARVALGDLSQASGDPVTACEHWQIARKLFHEIGQKVEFDAVDARMLRNGCPSDWVLTDF